mgnify:CR=1 FL=1
MPIFGKKMQTMQIRLTEEMLKELGIIITKEKLYSNKSELIRSIVREYLENRSRGVK